jgi:hypothetical protein
VREPVETPPIVASRSAPPEAPRAAAPPEAPAAEAPPEAPPEAEAPAPVVEPVGLPALVPSERAEKEPVTLREGKPKRPRPAKMTDADALARLERALRRSCAAEGVTVRFTVKSNGEAGLVRVLGPSAEAAKLDCVRSQVRAASFPAGELRALKLVL